MNKRVSFAPAQMVCRFIHRRPLPFLRPRPRQSFPISRSTRGRRCLLPCCSRLQQRKQARVREPTSGAPHQRRATMGRQPSTHLPRCQSRKLGAGRGVEDVQLAGCATSKQHRPIRRGSHATARGARRASRNTQRCGLGFRSVVPHDDAAVSGLARNPAPWQRQQAVHAAAVAGRRRRKRDTVAAGSRGTRGGCRICTERLLPRQRWSVHDTAARAQPAHTCAGSFHSSIAPLFVPTKSAVPSGCKHGVSESKPHA